jgi:divalent metal cation (Fe/Co/Zn/Cd) transporter
VTQTEDASLRTVVVAVAANLLVAVAKGVAALVTSSAAMLAKLLCLKRPMNRALISI